MKIFSTSQNPKDVLNQMNNLSQDDINVGDLVKINNSSVIAQVSSLYHSARDNCKMLTLVEYRKVSGESTAKAFLYGTVSQTAVTRISDSVTFA